jgi:tetratricopeptide (TPR) repeat protein
VLTFPTDDFLSWASSGKALAGLERFDEALAAYDEALVLRPEIANVWRKKAGVLRALGRETEAQEAERQADGLEQ